MYDILIIGGGPAGVSAALTAHNRGKSAAIITNPYEGSGLYKAKEINNYPGLRGASGAKLLETMYAELSGSGIEVIHGRALSAMPISEGFAVSVGQDYISGKALIIAVGITQSALFPGEAEYLGRGVSYCATCDGMLYRNRSVAVIGLSDESESEAAFLRSIGCKVEYFGRERAKRFKICGGDTVQSLIADDTEYSVDGVFVLRKTIAPSALLSGLELSDGHILANDMGQTSVEGVFAAGDCVGRPYQVARAVGQGNTAALSACEYLDKG